MTNAWVRQVIKLNLAVPADAYFQLVIEGQTNANVNSDLAIDDTVFSPGCKRYQAPTPSPSSLSTTPGGAQTSPATTSTALVRSTTVDPCGDLFNCHYGPRQNTCVKRSQVCDFVSDCPNGADEIDCATCDFETSACGWTDVSHGTYFWNRTRAEYTSIPSDVTLGTASGSIMHSALAKQISRGTNRLFTPSMGKTYSHCEFRFYYYKHDYVYDSVGLSLNYMDANYQAEKLWKTTNNSLLNVAGHAADDSASYWHLVQIGLHSRPANFKLFFERFQASKMLVLDTHGDQLAIDDTAFVNCGPSIPSIPCHSTNAFKCKNGDCIPNNLVGFLFNTFSKTPKVFYTIFKT